MNTHFITGFEKTAFVSNVTKLVRTGGKALLRKAKNVGVKTPKSPGSMAGLAATTGFAGMEVAGVGQKVKSHMSSPVTTMKTQDFFKRG